MATIELSDTHRAITIESATTLGVTSPAVVQLVEALTAFEQAVPGLLLLRFTIPVAAPVYRYRFEASDGRKWRQDITVPAEGEARMTFDVPNEWALSEFAPHRPLRSKLVDMVRRNGLTRVVVDWPG